MNATSQATLTRTLVDAEALERFRRTTGREGLAALLSALRSLVQILLKPFRAIAKLKYGSGNAEGGIVPGQPADAQASARSSLDEVALPNSAPNETAVAAQLLDGAADSLQLELAGEQKELDEIMPMLQRHMELLLKDHLSKDADKDVLMDRLGTLAEAAERGRYAHAIAARQVGQAQEYLAEQKQYIGMSERAISELVILGYKTKEGRALYAEGTPEATLLTRMAFRDHVAATYAAQVRQIALLILRDTDEQGVEAKLEHVLQMASQTSDRLGSRFPRTLTLQGQAIEGFESALRAAIAEGVEALEKANSDAEAALAAAAPAPAPAPAVVQHVAAKVTAPVTKPSTVVTSAPIGAGGFGGSASQAQRDAERAAVANDFDDSDFVMS